MNQEEVVREEACADVTDVGETDSPPNLAGGRLNVVHTSIFKIIIMITYLYGHE